MIKFLFWIFVLSSFLCSDDIFKPLFPKGEDLQNAIINTPNNISNALISNSGNFFITVSDYPSQIQFWDKSKQKIYFIKKTNSISYIQITHDDKYLIYDEYDSINIFNIQTKKLEKKIDTKERVLSLDISQDGKFIIYVTKENKLKIFDLEKNSYKDTNNLENPVYGAKISRSNRYLLLKLDKSKLGLYDFNTSAINYLDINSTNIKEMAISDNEKYILGVSDTKINLWDIEKQKNIISDDGNTAPITKDSKKFTIRKIINLFKKIDVEKVTIDEIKESFDRLELSYILARDGQSYFYTIPLFQEHLQREDVKAIFDEMVDEFRREYSRG